MVRIAALAVLLLAALPWPAAGATNQLFVYRYSDIGDDNGKTRVRRESGYLFAKEGFVASTVTESSTLLVSGKPFSQEVLYDIEGRFVVKLADWLNKAKTGGLAKYVRSREKYLINGVLWVTVCVRGKCGQPAGVENACVL